MRERRRRLHTILRACEIHVRIAKGGPPRLIPTNPNGQHRRNLLEQIVQLSFADGSVEIAHVQRRIGESCRRSMSRHRRGLLHRHRRKRLRCLNRRWLSRCRHRKINPPNTIKPPTMERSRLSGSWSKLGFRF